MLFPCEKLSAWRGSVTLADTNLDSVFSLTVGAKRREYEYNSLGSHCELLYIAVLGRNCGVDRGDVIGSASTAQPRRHASVIYLRLHSTLTKFGL
jgi:hypothetical protein